MAKRAKQGFVCKADGRKRFMSRGDVVSDKDPVVKGREAMFDDIVEDAAQAPGQRKRSRRQAEQSEGEGE